ncbi:MAG: hypothetical protein KC589_09810 [Nanoarchaeota archaeon]|nr:hypothetical protein [Nanoarchaeota archaeon]
MKITNNNKDSKIYKAYENVNGSLIADARENSKNIDKFNSMPNFVKQIVRGLEQ